jgi:DNA polymerase elongation subunit (family B)
MKTKILLYDIETSPSLGYTWEMWETNVLKVIQPWYMLCFSYKWLGEKKTHVISLPQFKGYKKNHRDDKELVKKLWSLFEEADIIMGHNGDRFDIKKTNAKFIEHGFNPPEPYKTIDTLKIARRYFKFDSNKLDSLGEYLGVGRKMKTGGFDLWLDCMDGDMKAWVRMEKYNKQDVVLLEKVYLKLRPWIQNHPNLNILDNKYNSCPNCKSSNLHKRGFSLTTIGKKQRWQCKDCGAWSTSTKTIKTNITIK